MTSHVTRSLGNKTLAAKIATLRNDLCHIVDLHFGLLSMLCSMGVITPQQIDLVKGKQTITSQVDQLARYYY
jgi:hypothetical protein